MTLRPFVLIIIVAAILATAILPSPASASATELVVSVAASLKDVSLELQRVFAAEHPELRLRYNFGSSGSLEQQITRGAPVDIFLSAAEAPIKRLVDRERVAPELVRVFATNQLVLIRSARYGPNNLIGWPDLDQPAIGRLAIGNPRHVPVGIYAQALLQHLGLWTQLQDRIVTGEDVRQVLQFVRLGAVDAGIVYATDVRTVDDVMIVASAPPEAPLDIVYPAAVVNNSRHPQEAEMFLRFLLTPKAQEVLAAWGFGGGR